MDSQNLLKICPLTFSSNKVELWPQHLYRSVYFSSVSRREWSLPDLKPMAKPLLIPLDTFPMSDHVDNSIQYIMRFSVSSKDFQFSCTSRHKRSRKGLQNQILKHSSLH